MFNKDITLWLTGGCQIMSSLWWHLKTEKAWTEIQDLIQKMYLIKTVCGLIITYSTVTTSKQATTKLLLDSYSQFKNQEKTTFKIPDEKNQIWLKKAVFGIDMTRMWRSSFFSHTVNHSECQNVLSLSADSRHF